MTDSIRVTVWNEYRHEQTDDHIREVYPGGIHGAIAQHLREEGFAVRTATLDEPKHGLTQQVLDNTDVLIWWGHMAHGEVDDGIAADVRRRILDGMGLIVLHSGHLSKVFVGLMGTSCELKWREMNERERVWVVEPGHPIAAGLDQYFEIPQAEMYGERFDIPCPDALVFISWFQGGEVFRSGCCFHRGNGKIFYFRPGHETLPIFYQPEVRRVISNAVRWAAPAGGPRHSFGHHPEPIEALTAIS